MRAESYRIADEPTPGALAYLAVNPLWPFMAVMFGGIWLSWGWFIINGVAVGSPTRKREWLWIAAGVVVAIGLLATIFYLSAAGVIAKTYIKYALLSVVAWKIGVTYVLYNLQSHSIELYEYYGGRLQNGIFVIAAAYMFAPDLMKTMPPLLRLLLS